jgi:protein-tyrosine-phosphatase
MSKQTMLIIYIGNSARSQMGEALLRDMAGGRFEAASAGTKPRTKRCLALLLPG